MLKCDCKFSCLSSFRQYENCSQTTCAHQCLESSSLETLRSLNTKTKKISHQQILDCVIILLARPRTKNYSARISCNLVQLIRLFITVFTLTPPKVYTDPLQPIRPNNYITESPPNWHIYCHAELHSMDLQSIDLHADIQVFIWFASFKVNVFHC